MIELSEAQLKSQNSHLFLSPKPLRVRDEQLFLARVSSTKRECIYGQRGEEAVYKVIKKGTSVTSKIDNLQQFAREVFGIELPEEVCQLFPNGL